MLIERGEIESRNAASVTFALLQRYARYFCVTRYVTRHGSEVLAGRKRVASANQACRHRVANVAIVSRMSRGGRNGEL